jgi:thiamine-phosphate diphosphorylase
MPRSGAVPPLHAVASELILADPAFPALAAAIMAVGQDRIAIHLRSATHTARELLELALMLRVSAERTGGVVLVADRVDVALAAGIDGATLTARSLTVTAARQIAPRLLLGASVHDADDAWVQSQAGADFLVASRPTGVPAPATAGAEYLSPIVRAAEDVPVIAVGGVTPERVEALVHAGASGIAAARGFWLTDAEAATRHYLAAYDEARSTRRWV